MKLTTSIASACFAAVAALLAACGSGDGATGTGGTGGHHPATSSASTTSSAGTTSSASTTSSSGGAAPLQPADLVGEWASAGCEAYDNGMGGKNYLTRDFKLTETTWHLDVELFGDDKCTAALFTSAIDGPYTLGKLSATVAGATEAEFAFTKNVWTAHAKMLADAFTMAKCGAAAWQVETPQDVTQTGCIGVAQPIAQCPKEYDVISVQGSDLYFGQRLASLCTLSGRPKALGQYPVVKK